MLPGIANQPLGSATRGPSAVVRSGRVICAQPTRLAMTRIIRSCRMSRCCRGGCWCRCSTVLVIMACAEEMQRIPGAFITCHLTYLTRRTVSVSGHVRRDQQEATTAMPVDAFVSILASMVQAESPTCIWASLGCRCTSVPACKACCSVCHLWRPDEDVRSDRRHRQCRQFDVPAVFQSKYYCVHHHNGGPQERWCCRVWVPSL